MRPSRGAPTRWHRRLEARVLVSGALVAGAALIALLTATAQVITQDARSRVLQDLEAAKATFDGLLADRGRTASAQLRLVAELPVLRAHMTDPSARGDHATISVMAEHYRRSLGADFCLVSDAEGQSMGAAGGRESFAEALLPLRETVSPQSGRTLSALNGALYIVVSEPARFADEVLGVLTVGYAVDDQMARALARRTRAEVSFLTDGQVVGSSLPPNEWPRFDARLAGDASSGLLLRSSPTTSSVQREYVGRRYALAGLGDPEKNAILLMADWGPTQRVLEQMRHRLTVVTAGTFGFAIAGMLFFSRRVSRPLQLIAETADDIARGDSKRRLSVQGSAEAALMATAFNDMTTSLFQRADELERARDAAQDAARAKDSFLANMSHELRTPMNGVVGSVDLLANTDLSDKQRRFTQLIQTSAKNLMTLLNEILDFSKLSAGQMQLDTVEFRPREMVERVAELMAASAQQKGVEINYDVSAAVPEWVAGDAHRLEQVLLNLVGNAVKFTATGAIVIRTGATRAHDTVVELRMEVQDSGIGMDDTEVAHVFEAFTQADGSTTRKYGGTGLGLAICHRWIDLMQGQIGVTSTRGTGSTFWFTVPLTVGAATNRPHQDRPSVLQDARVLIVDDTAVNVEILQHYVDAWGMSRAVARHATEARDHLRTAVAAGYPYDVVLVDMHLPDEDGVELVRRIRADSALGAPRIIILSSVADQLDGATTAALEIGACLTKPVRARELRAALTTANVRTQVADAVSVHARDATSPPFEGRRVLLAEDNEINQAVACGMLMKLGCDVEVVATGRAAHGAYTRGGYDLVLMDCQMPDLDGYEATRLIRRDEAARLAAKPSTRRLPILAMTASALERDRQRCVEAGMDAHVSKPIRLDDLHTALTPWLVAMPSTVKA